MAVFIQGTVPENANQYASPLLFKTNINRKHTVGIKKNVPLQNIYIFLFCTLE